MGPVLQTLNAVNAHQAVGALVTLYADIIADAERTKEFLLSQIETLKNENKRLREELEKVTPPKPTASGR